MKYNIKILNPKDKIVLIYLQHVNFIFESDKDCPGLRIKIPLL